MAGAEVYGVHAVLAVEVRATEAIFRRLAAAERHAQILSRDSGVLATAITRYVLDEPGQRTAVSLYVDGCVQQVPYVSDSRKIFAGGAHRSP